MTSWFLDDDPGYVAWLADHQAGFVLNTWAHVTSGYLVLHSASCPAINRRLPDGRSWTHQAPRLDTLGVGVTPLICVHRADLPWFNRRVRGIPIVSGRGLLRAIRRRPACLTADQVDGLTRLAIASLPA